MPNNKNAIIRYQALDVCFRNTGRKYFINDLLEACNRRLTELNPHSNGIKERQLKEDIRFMKSESGYAAPIVGYPEGKKKFYRYEDRNFSINNSPLNASEAEQLNAALAIMQRFTGTPMFEWVQDVVGMLENKLGLAGKQKEVIDFDGNVDLKGRNHLKPLFDAIVNRQVVIITYRDFDGPEAYTLTFHAYYLKQFNNRWFVFGLHEEQDIPTWNLAVDRIEKIRVAHELAYRPDQTDWQEFFYDMVGVTRLNCPVEKVMLRFKPTQARYVESKPLHPTQRIVNSTETHTDIRIEVLHNFELEQLIFSFGDRVEVMEPATLREAIARRVEKLHRLYGQK